MKDRETTVLNDILQGEISALETYQQVLDKVESDPRSADLRLFFRDHQDAVSKLKSHVFMRKEMPETTSGAWGAWAQTVTGAAKIFGNRSAIKALKEGEEHGLKQYEDALEKNIDPSLKNIIRTEFIPNQRRHIAALDRIIDRMAS